MIQTFTSEFEHTAKQKEKEPANLYPCSEEPSQKTLTAILNYSKNLDVRSSKMLPYIEFIKS